MQKATKPEPPKKTPPPPKKQPPKPPKEKEEKEDPFFKTEEYEVRTPFTLWSLSRFRRQGNSRGIFAPALSVCFATFF